MFHGFWFWCFWVWVLASRLLGLGLPGLGFAGLGLRPGFLGFGVAAFEVSGWVSGFGRCLTCQLLITDLGSGLACRTRPQSPPPHTRPRQTHSLPLSGSVLFRLHVLYANLLYFRGGLDRASEGSGLLQAAPQTLSQNVRSDGV